MHELFSLLITHLVAAWRYRWYAVVFAWVAAIGGWVFVYFIPDRYEASARVYVDTQSVLKPLLAGITVQPNVDQVVGMMGRTLISRPNLEKVIRMADLDIKLKTPADRENMITNMTKLLEIKSAGRENLYTISYIDKNAQEAKRVVQSLLTIFVEGSLVDKRKDSDVARRFIDDQLKAYGEKLTAAENAVTEFKQRNFGLLPGDGRNFYTQLGEAGTALNQAKLELTEAENARDAIRKQLTTGEALPNLLEERGPIEPENREIDARIQALQQKLDSLRLTYTEQHPDIKAILRSIDQLNAQKEKEAKLSKPTPPPARVRAENPLAQQLSVAIAQAEARVASLKARAAEYERRVIALKASANAAPQVEAEFKMLTRDYEVTKGNYEKLLARRESAQISGDMEASTNVMEFRVIDPPQVPNKPSSPNRPLLMSVVFLAALAGGCGLAFLLSQARPTIGDERRLQEVGGGLEVFGTVIMVLSDAQRAKRKKGVIAIIAATSSLVAAYAAVMGALMVVAMRS